MDSAPGFFAGAPASNVTEYSVSGLAAALKRTVEDNYGYVRVRGEVSGFKGVHSSGHCYFTLKDDKARIEAVIWRTTLQRIRFRPQEGLEVIASGKLTTFPASSKYQLVIDALEPAGAGALMALLDERRRKLAAEGLFDAARKRPLPFLPRVIGVVTSPTGAVIRDILHRLADRCPTRVVVWPVRVQGETAAAEVVAAIAGFNALPDDGQLPRPDVLIVARGGGSLEDLWPFNEEIVVRAAAASRIPLISAVGHETDTTLIDHAADLRAPTPTGAAELAVPVRAELAARLSSTASRGLGAMVRSLDLRRRELAAASRALPSAGDLLGIPRRTLDELGARLGRSLGASTLAHRGRLDRAAAGLSPSGLVRLVDQARARLEAAAARKRQALSVHAERKRAAFSVPAARLRVEAIGERIAGARQRVRDAEGRATRALRQSLNTAWQKLEALDKLLDAFALSKESILARGFALVHRAADGELIRSAMAVPPGGALELEFADGRVAAVAGTGAAAPKRPRRRTVAPSPDQGSLFDPTPDP
ncbi:MAG: exodeoxyribonuclease VII large subunit [Bauldia sp.]|nr:exodeoxyribonuclease VII large subunit [Bauldia sp.]